jgi:hypothetical protein
VRLCPLLLLAGLLLLPVAGRADTAMGMELMVADPLASTESRTETGVGLVGRFGWEAPLPFLIAGVEACFGLTTLQPEEPDGRSENLLQALAGVRGGLDWALAPQIFLRGGMGRVSSDAVGWIKKSGWMLQTGAMLDFNALPYLRVGALAAYNLIGTGKQSEFYSGPTTRQWFSWGLQVSAVM